MMKKRKQRPDDKKTVYLVKTVQQSTRRNLTQKTTNDRDAKKYQTQLKIRQKPEKHFSLFIVSLTQHQTVSHSFKPNFNFFLGQFLY